MGPSFAGNCKYTILNTVPVSFCISMDHSDRHGDIKKKFVDAQQGWEEDMLSNFIEWYRNQAGKLFLRM